MKKAMLWRLGGKMIVPDQFLELYFGKNKQVDLHNLTKEDAKIQLIYEIENSDADVDCLVVVHGYRHGTTIKNFVRKEFFHSRIDKMVNLDAGRTIILLKK